MDNTRKLLRDEVEHWYYAQGTQPVGPITAAEVVVKIRTGDLTGAHSVWKKGMKSWKRLCEIDQFLDYLPVVPENRPEPDSEPKVWFVYLDEQQVGPFSASEMKQLILEERVTHQTYVWRKGQKNWELLTSVKGFTGLVRRPKTRKTLTKVDQRKTPRAPWTAKVILTNSESVIFGVCNDISEGGMQILTDQIPGPKGTKVRLNVSAVSESQKKGSPFVAEGVVVRILDDHRGFSLKFTQINDKALEIIRTLVK